MALGWCVEFGSVTTLVTQICLLQSWVLLLLKIVTPVNLNHYVERPAKVKEERDGFIIVSFSSDTLQVLTLTSVKLVLIQCREKQAFYSSLNGRILGVFFCGLKQEKMEYFHFLYFLQWLVLFRKWIEHIFSAVPWASWVNIEPMRQSLFKPSAGFLLVWWYTNITNSHNRAYLKLTANTGINIHLLRCHGGFNAVLSHFGSVFWLCDIKTGVPEERAAAPPEPDSEAGRGYPVRGSACKNWCHHIHRSPHAPKDQAPVHPEGHNHSLQWSLRVSSAADTHRACELLRSQGWLHLSPLFEVRVNREYDLAASLLYLGETQLYWTGRIYPGVCAKGSFE